MAQVSVLGVTDTTITVNITGLSQPQNQYGGFRVRVAGGSWLTISVNPSNSGTSTSSRLITGLSPATTYTIQGEAYTNAWYAVSSTTATTNAPPAPPPAPSSASATPTGATSATFSWSSVSGATGYHVYRDGSYHATTSSTSYSFSGLSEYTLYTLGVVAYNAHGNSPIVNRNVRTLDVTPPTISIISTSATATSITLNASATDAHSGVRDYTYLLNGSFVVTKTSSSHTYTGLTPSTPYTVSVRATDHANNNSPTTARAVSTLSNLPNTPSSPVSVSSRPVGGFVLTWGTSSGATSYVLAYRVAGTSTFSEITGISSTSYTFSVANGNPLTYGQTYEFRVKGRNSNGDSAYTGVNPATVNPRTPSISVAEATNDTIRISFSGMTGIWDDIRVNRYSESSVYIDTRTVTSGTANWTGLPSGQTYRFDAQSSVLTPSSTRLYSGYSNTVIASTSARPDNFVWTYPKEYYQNVFVTAGEWGLFTSRINAFRVYKGLGTISFTTVTSGVKITADIYNQARNAIAAMSPPTPPPSAATKDVTNIGAFHFNNLATSLNSIT